MTTYLAVDHVLFNESDAAAVFTVRVIGDAPQSDISVLYNTQTASARGTVNYTGVSVDTPATVTIAAGQTEATISIPLLNDGVDALLKGFLLQLSLPAGSSAVLTNSQAVALISDSAGNAAIPTFRTHDAVVDETGSHALVQYTLDTPTDHDVTVDYTTRGLNALAGEDFAAVSGTLTIAAGQTAGTISIPIYKDGVVEAREMFAVNFSNPVGLTIAEPVAHVTIEAQNGALNAQGLTGVRAIGNIAYEDEGYIDLFVALTAASATEVKVNYATGASTARYNVDYYHQTGTLVFAPGEVIKTVRVLLGNQPGDDGTVASREFTFSLNVTNGIHQVSNAKGVILNRDTPVPDTQVITPMSGETTGGLLYGTSNDDSIVGGSGNDQLDGHEGNDTMVGGVGDDTYVLEQAGDSAVEAADSGNDTLITSLGSATLDANFENLVLASTTDMAATGTGNAANNLIVGNDGGNVLTGLGGNDTLEGGAGNDTLVGGLGDDVYGVDSISDVVTELAGEGTQDTIRAWITYSLSAGSNIENLSLAGRADINATGDLNDNILTGNVGANLLDGGAGNDILYGGDGNDTLTGGTGNDTMAGGKGDDSYNVEVAGDVLVEAVGGGTDTVTTTVDYTLTTGAEIERAYLSGTATKLTGNEFANALFGGDLADSLVGAAGNDTFDGGAGNDTLVGGLGDDVYLVAAGDVVVEDSAAGTDEVRTSLTTYALGANVDNLVFTGATASTGTGNGLDNRVTGTVGNDTLSGGAGNDTLDGAAGDDSMTGGAGNDLYLVDSAADTLVEAAGAGTGTDTVQTALSYTLADNFENLTLTGGAAVNGTGNTADNLLTGNSGANTLTGLDGNDTLDGGAGADAMTGGAGDDTYVVDNVGDSVTELAAGGTDTVLSSISFSVAALGEIENVTLTGTTVVAATGNAKDNVLVGNSAANTLSGADGNDTLTGGDGNDTLDGGTGNDSLVGGAGDDGYRVDAAGDTVVEAAGGGSDTVTASVDYTLAGGVEVERLVSNGSAHQLGGNEYNNTLVGTTAADTLLGAAGNDTLQGGGGADSMDGGSGDDTYEVDNADDLVTEAASGGSDTIVASIDYSLALGLEVEVLQVTGSATRLTGNELANKLIGGSANDSLDGQAGNDSLLGGVGTDTLMGGDGSDTLDGGIGSDSLVGSAGDDVYYRDATGDTVVEAVGEGTDMVYSSVNYTLAANIERLALLTGGFNGGGNALDNQITGNAANNLLAGAAGNDTLDGSTGADSLYGGLGDDVYYRDNAGDGVVETAGEGYDTVYSSVNYTLAANVEKLILTGAATNGGGNALANLLTGNANANLLAGVAGNDTLDGGAGIDSLYGGVGDDTYYVESTGDVVVENAGEGNDAVISSANYSLSANIESLTLTGIATNGGGNAQSNLITGNALNNLLSGAAGNDTLAGGDGNDSLYGGTGTNTLDGGAGNDVYYTDSTSDVFVEAVGAGTDTVMSSYNATLGANLENLTLTGSATNGGGNDLANIITGNAAANLLAGAGGDDTLIGGLGNDTIYGGVGSNSVYGGGGDDTYYRDSATETIVELLGEGVDTVYSSVNYTLAANVEKLFLTGTATNGGGNALDNALTGNTLNNLLAGAAGNDTLDGSLGADMLVGGLGSDVYYRDNIGDLISEAVGEGTDTVYSSVNYTLAANVEKLSLTGTATNGGGNALANAVAGNALSNVLAGAAGADSLFGGLGNDTLYGGADSDTFVFDTALGAGNVDTVADWTAGDTVALDNDVFTALGAPGVLAAAQFFSGAGLTGSTSAAQGVGVYYDSSSGSLYYDADGFGGAAAVQFATLAGKPVVSAAAFVVID